MRNDLQDDIILGLKNLYVKYFNKVIMEHLNINSIRSKFELLSSLIGGKISETKLDATFPANQFFIQGYSTVYRLDRNNKVGGIMLFVRDEIITFPLDQYSFPVGFEAFCIELKLRTKKWLMGSLNVILKNWEKPSTKTL